MDHQFRISQFDILGVKTVMEQYITKSCKKHGEQKHILVARIGQEQLDVVRHGSIVKQSDSAAVNSHKHALLDSSYKRVKARRVVIRPPSVHIESELHYQGR